MLIKKQRRGCTHRLGITMVTNVVLVNYDMQWQGQKLKKDEKVWWQSVEAFFTSSGFRLKNVGANKRKNKYQEYCFCCCYCCLAIEKYQFSSSYSNSFESSFCKFNAKSSGNWEMEIGNEGKKMKLNLKLTFPMMDTNHKVKAGKWHSKSVLCGQVCIQMRTQYGKVIPIDYYTQLDTLSAVHYSFTHLYSLLPFGKACLWINQHNAGLLVTQFTIN